MDIVRYTHPSELSAVREAWTRLSEQERQFVPDFADFEHDLAKAGARFCIFAAIEKSKINALACFLYHDTVKRYSIATHKLLELPVRKVYLFGSCMPGQPSEAVVRSIFQLMIAEGGFDEIDAGQILTDTTLYRALTSLPRRVIVWQSFRRSERRWLIRLPATFDQYLATLGAESRRHANRYCRKLEQEGAEYRIMTQADEVEAFLRDAETISRTTYQWKLGRGVRNDERGRQWLRRIAQRGSLRCCLLYLNGKPCAFGWGELAHRTFYYQAIGYDPEFAKVSPGIGLFTQLMRDLIENTDCQTFDFGSGGEHGYKSRLAPLSLDCVSLEIAPISRPYSIMLAVIDRGLILIKNAIMNAMEWAAGRGALKQRLKALLRPFGVANY